MSSSTTPVPPPPSDISPQIVNLQRELTETRQQARAIAQYLWLMVARYEEASMDVTLDTSKLDPLWQLPFLQVLDDKGEMDPNKIRILAGTLPPLTEQDKKRLVRRLRSTNLELTAVLQEFKLTDYPPHYVERFLVDRIKWDKEQKVWASVTPAGAGEKLKNLLHFPA